MRVAYSWINTTDITHTHIHTHARTQEKSKRKHRNRDGDNRDGESEGTLMKRREERLSRQGKC